MNPDKIRSWIPLPRFPHPLIGWGLFVVAVVILYDSYDGSGKKTPFPFGSALPF